MTDERHSAANDPESRGTSGQLTRRTEDKDVTTAEWTTLAISSATLLAFIGAITWLSFMGEERPPVIVVEPDLEQVRNEESGYYLPVTIRNDGDRTVEDAIIQGQLVTGEAEPETADITITFLSGGERVQGTLVFQSDPAQGELTTGVTSYKEP